jgi:hypothetical protein
MHFLKIESVRHPTFFFVLPYTWPPIVKDWFQQAFPVQGLFFDLTLLVSKSVTRILTHVTLERGMRIKKPDRKREIVIIRERENITRRQISPRSLHSLVIFSRSIAVGGSGKTIGTISFRCEPDWWGAFVTYCWNFMRVLHIRWAFLTVLVFSLLGNNFAWSGLRVMFIFVLWLKFTHNICN